MPTKLRKVMELSYSLHLGRNQNRTRRARVASKNTLSGTTSYSNNGIQNARVLSKVCKHNLRLYENNNENIVTIVGTNDASNDVKNTYLELFEEARINYNNTQTRTDRKIDNYFNYISDSKTKDLACEIIIELGNKDFWSDKNKKFKDKMINVFKEQIKDLEEVVPNFKVSNVTIHLDEHSPHIHIVGVPFKDGYKNGMKRQVAKSLIFTRDSLRNIQDKMRLKCINEFNKEYNLDYTLINKEQGRNNDIPVYLMNKI